MKFVRKSGTLVYTPDLASGSASGATALLGNRTWGSLATDRAFVNAKANPGTTLGSSQVAESNFGAVLQASGNSAVAYTSDTTLGSAIQITTSVGGGMGFLIAPQTGITNSAFLMTQFKPYLRMKLKTNSVLTNSRIWVGMFSTNPGTSDDPAAHLAAFRFSSTASDVNWRCCTKDGVTLNNTDSGVAVQGDTIYILEIEVLANGNIQFSINGSIVQTLTTNLPTTTTQLPNPGLYGQSPATAAFVIRCANLYVSMD